jgi:hypothetical protein
MLRTLMELLRSSSSSQSSRSSDDVPPPSAVARPRPPSSDQTQIPDVHWQGCFDPDPGVDSAVEEEADSLLLVASRGLKDEGEPRASIPRIPVADESNGRGKEGDTGVGGNEPLRCSAEERFSWYGCGM